VKVDDLTLFSSSCDRPLILHNSSLFLVFFVQNDAIARIIAGITQQLIHPTFASQIIEDFGFCASIGSSRKPSPSSPIPTPVQTLLDRLNTTESTNRWLKSHRQGQSDSILDETAIPAKVTKGR
jgi:hypothetical protein